MFSNYHFHTSFLPLENSARLGKDILLADQLRLALRGGRRGGWVFHCACLEAQDLTYTWNILEMPCDAGEWSYVCLITSMPNVCRTTIRH